MTRKNALDSGELRRLFPQTPEAFRQQVERTLRALPAGEGQAARCRIRPRLVIALLLALCLAAAALAAALNPTAEIFGFLYGSRRRDALLAGDVAIVGRTLETDAFTVTLEETVYDAADDMPGLYGTGTVTPKAGFVLLPEEYGPDTPAGYRVFFGPDEKIPADAPTYAQLAQQRGAQMLEVFVRVDDVASDIGHAGDSVGYTMLPQQDGTLRFAFEVDDVRRAERYDLSMRVLARTVDAQGQTGDMQRHAWQVRVRPELSAAERADIAAQTPVPVVTPVPVPADALRVVCPSWGSDEYVAAYPGRAIQGIPLERGDVQAFLMDDANAWDAAFVWLDEVDLNALRRSGKLLDLNVDSALRAAIARMIAPVRAAVAGDAGAYALPTAMLSAGRELAMAPGHIWAQLGWTDADVPATFADLCALAERYMALPMDARCGTRFVEGESNLSVRRWLLKQLISLQQQEIRAGSADTYDTPGFRQGLAQLERAVAALSGRQAQRGANGTYVLFHDAGQSLTAERLLPLALNTAPRFPQRLEALVINAQSRRVQQALDFARWKADNQSGQFLELLEASMPAREIGRRAMAYSLLTRMLFDQEDTDLNAMRDRLARGDTEAYAPDERLLARYRAELAPAVIVLRARDGSVYAPAEAYLVGELDEDALIDALDGTRPKSDGR